MTSWIVITGAGSGIGRGAALRLAKAGHSVLAAVQYPQQVSEVRAAGAAFGDKLRVEKIDMLKQRDRDFLASQDIAVLVNNAALSETGPIAEQPLDLVRDVFETNVFMTLALTQAVVKNMVAKGKGRVIFMSSMAGLMPIPYVGAYCASKHALEAIAACMNAELTPHGVQVLTCQPGPYKTGFNDRMWDTNSRWMNEKANFTRRSDMQGTASILDSQFDPAEAEQALADLCVAPAPRYRNVAPKAIEDAVKATWDKAWTRTV